MTALQDKSVIGARHATLEEKLRKAAIITVGDRIDQLKGASRPLAVLGLSLAGAAGLAYLGYSVYEQHVMMEAFSPIEGHLTSITRLIESAKDLHVSFRASPEMLTSIEPAVQKLVRMYDTPAGQEFLRSLHDHASHAASYSPDQMAAAADSLSGRLTDVTQPGLFAGKVMAMTLGTIADLVSFFMGGAVLLEKDTWYSYKIEAKKDLKERISALQELGASLRRHPYAEQVYDFAESAFRTHDGPEDALALIRVLRFLSGQTKIDPDPKEVYGALVPSAGTHVRHIQEALDSGRTTPFLAYEEALKKDKADPAQNFSFKKAYLHMLRTGTSASSAMITLDELAGIPENRQELFYLLQHTNQLTHAHVIDAYKALDLAPDKKIEAIYRVLGFHSPASREGERRGWNDV